MILQYLKTSLLLLLSVQQAYAGNTIECTGGICRSIVETVDLSSYIVPEYILAGTHPGLYMGSTGIEDEEAFRAIRVEEFNKPQQIAKLQLFGNEYAYSVFHKLGKLYKIDQKAGEGHPQERTAHDKAWQWAKQNILLAKKPLSDYMASDLLHCLNHLNDLLIPPVSYQTKLMKYLADVANFGQHGRTIDDPSLKPHIEDFNEQQSRLQNARDTAGSGSYSRLRQSPAVIIMDQNFPGFHKYEESLNYIKKEYPQDAKTFKKVHRKVMSVARRGTADTDYAILNTVLFESTAKERKLLEKLISLPMDVKDLPQAMKQFLQDLPAKIQENPIAGAVFAHNQIAKLHPYDDANGRTARLLMNCILLQNGYQAVHFYRNKDYTAAVSESIRQDDNIIFETFLRGQLKMQQKGQVEQDDLAEKMKHCIDDCQELLEAEFEEYEQLGLSP